jgi:hypothetical protein
MSMLVFWVVAACGLVGTYQCFIGTQDLHFLGSTAHKTTSDV